MPACGDSLSLLYSTARKKKEKDEFGTWGKRKSNFLPYHGQNFRNIFERKNYVSKKNIFEVEKWLKKMREKRMVQGWQDGGEWQDGVNNLKIFNKS